jgi:putative ABC transport system permease protein
MLGVGLLTPCLAALPPVFNAIRISVREAIASDGTATEFGNSLIDRLVGHFRGLSRPLLMSLRNVFRHKGRLVLTLSALALAGAIFMSVFTAHASVVNTIERLMPLLISDLSLDFKYTYRTEKITQIIEQTPGVVHAEGWVITLGELLEADNHTVADRFTIYAPPLDSSFTSQHPVVEGRWLQEGDRNALVITTEVARRYPALKIGDAMRLRINGRIVPFVIVGKYEDVSGEEAKRAFASYAYISQVMGEPGRARSYRVMMESSEPVFQAQVGGAVLDAVEQPGDTPAFITGTSVRKLMYVVANGLAAVLMIVALLIVAVGSIGLASTMSMNVLERTREIGVMRAIGARNADVRRMVVAEGTLVGVLSWLIALGLSFPLSHSICNVIGMAQWNRPLDYIFNWIGVAIWLGLVTVISALSSLGPAINAARMTVRDALAYE